jgi:hypothetical protein
MCGSCSAVALQYAACAVDAAATTGCELECGPSSPSVPVPGAAPSASDLLDLPRCGDTPSRHLDDGPRCCLLRSGDGRRWSECRVTFFRSTSEIVYLLVDRIFVLGSASINMSCHSDIRCEPRSAILGRFLGVSSLRPNGRSLYVDSWYRAGTDESSVDGKASSFHQNTADARAKIKIVTTDSHRVGPSPFPSALPRRASLRPSNIFKQEARASSGKPEGERRT